MGILRENQYCNDCVISFFNLGSSAGIKSACSVNLSLRHLWCCFVFSHDEVQNSIEKIHILMLIAAIILGVAFTVRYFGVSYSSEECLKSFLTNCYLWAAVLAILGCGKAWFNNTSAFASYMTKSSFGFYVVHYLVAQLTCYLVYYYGNFPRAINYFLALAIELTCTVLIYELLKRVPVIRYLVLGIKANNQ